MKERTKPSVASVAGVILLFGLLCQRTQAQGIVDLGTSVLADAFGTASGPEALLVSWSVVESGSDVYTYTYVVNNPLGDVLLNNNGSPTLSPENVDAFSVGFDTTVAGSYIPGSQVGGTSGQVNDSGLFWSFTGIEPNSASPELSFESDSPPTMGNANAQDSNLPSPWSSFPNGGQVPVPTAVPEPTTMTLFALTALLVFPFRLMTRK